MSKHTWLGAAFGVILVNVVLPRVAPGIRAKIPV